MRPTEQIPPSAVRPKQRVFYPVTWLFRGLVLIFVFGVAAGVVMPGGGRTQVKGAQTKALVQAKQIGIALRTYAEDHNGLYPADTDGYGNRVQTSNDAFRNLFPTYLTNEYIFGNRLSVYQTAPPDTVIRPPTEVLQPGKNVYAYVMGTLDGMPGHTPLVVDGTDGTGRGLYVSDPKARGGVWKGARAVVIYLDNSSVLENMVGPENARCIVERLPNGTTRNLLSPDTLGPKLKLLDPAVAKASGL